MPRLGLLGIQALTLLRHVLVLHGTGVGGGSLVYANQLIVPDDAILSKPEWGREIGRNCLAPHFAEARRMLGAVDCPSVGNADQILREVGIELRGEDTFHINPVGSFSANRKRPSPTHISAARALIVPAANVRSLHDRLPEWCQEHPGSELSLPG